MAYDHEANFHDLAPQYVYESPRNELLAPANAIDTPRSLQSRPPILRSGHRIVTVGGHRTSLSCRTQVRTVRYQLSIARHSGSDRKYSMAARHLW